MASPGGGGPSCRPGGKNYRELASPGGGGPSCRPGGKNYRELASLGSGGPSCRSGGKYCRELASPGGGGPSCRPGGKNYRELASLQRRGRVAGQAVKITGSWQAPAAERPSCRPGGKNYRVLASPGRGNPIIARLARLRWSARLVFNGAATLLVFLAATAGAGVVAADFGLGAAVGMIVAAVVVITVGSVNVRSFLGGGLAHTPVFRQGGESSYTLTRKNQVRTLTNAPLRLMRSPRAFRAPIKSASLSGASSLVNSSKSPSSNWETLSRGSAFLAASNNSNNN